MTHWNPASRIVLLTLALLLAPVQHALAEQASIVAIVGDDIITMNDVSERSALIMATSGIPASDETQKKIMPRITKSLIDETLQLQEAKRNSLTVTDEEIQKTIDGMRGAGEDSRSIRDFIKSNHLAIQSLENQVRAQLAWSKFVQRKLRRNVSIAQDEVKRAQKAAATAPGELEFLISALDFMITDPAKEAEITASAKQAALQLTAGADMANLAKGMATNKTIQFKPALWVSEKKLPPAMQQLLRNLKDGEISSPLRTPKSVEIIQVLERRTLQAQAANAEYALKQIAISLPAKPDKKTRAKIEALPAALRASSLSCADETLPKLEFPAQANLVRTTLATLSPAQREIISHLEVGDLSAPFTAKDSLRFLMLCEMTEPSAGNLPNADKVRQALFAEKIELEAQKHLRNLRRDTFIDIKAIP